MWMAWKPFCGRETDCMIFFSWCVNTISFESFVFHLTALSYPSSMLSRVMNPFLPEMLKSVCSFADLLSSLLLLFVVYHGLPLKTYSGFPFLLLFECRNFHTHLNHLFFTLFFILYHSSSVFFFRSLIRFGRRKMWMGPSSLCMIWMSEQLVQLPLSCLKKVQGPCIALMDGFHISSLRWSILFSLRFLMRREWLDMNASDSWAKDCSGWVVVFFINPLFVFVYSENGLDDASVCRIR